jgi:hypothetical protein
VVAEVATGGITLIGPRLILAGVVDLFQAVPVGILETISASS